MIKLAIIVFIVSIFIGLIVVIIPKMVQKAKSQEISQINRENLLLKDATSIDGRSINFGSRKKFSVIIFFNPSCHICIEEMKSIRKRIDEFKETEIIFVSDVTKDSLVQYVQLQDFMDQANIFVVADTSRVITDYFRISIIPSIFIYDDAGRLVKHFQGETKIDAIIKYLQ
ncbi:MAG: redoxin domain-containing protein [Saprospiraceae bacterium]